MRRNLISFLCLLVGLYVGLGLVLRAVTAQQKRANDFANQADAVVSTQGPPLFLAVDQGDLKAVDHLLKSGADPNGTDRGLRTPLLVAAREGNQEAVKQLIAAGAQINAQDRTGSTALLYAVRSGRTPAVATLLLARGADAGHKDCSGETPLLMACDMADTTLLEALLAHGADVNMPDRIGLTPLMRVARGLVLERYPNNDLRDPALMREDAMRLLLQHGADIRLRDKQGWTALLYASENEPTGCLRILLEHGADLHVAVKGRTPLRNAAYRGLVENLQVLLAGDTKVRPDDVSDALMQATLTGHDDAVQFLIRHGADTNYCDQYGMTPLMLAIANDHVSTAKILVHYGANPRTRDMLGKTALDYAPPGQNGAIHTAVFSGMKMRMRQY